MVCGALFIFTLRAFSLDLFVKPSCQIAPLHGLNASYLQVELIYAA
jgi:hypothetical protein